MYKKLLLSTLYSAIAFCIISYASVMASLFKSVGSLTLKPVANIGFPYNYYYQFWLRGSTSPNCGWRFRYFVADALLTWLCCTVIYLALSKQKKP